MFDDINEQDNKNLQSTSGKDVAVNQNKNNNAVTSGSVAVEHDFQKKAENSSPQAQSSPLEDIFAETNKEEKPPVFQPTDSSVQSTNINSSEGGDSNFKKLIVLISLLLAFLGFCFAGYLAYQYFTGEQNTDNYLLDDDFPETIDNKDDVVDDLDSSSNNNEDVEDLNDLENLEVNENEENGINIPVLDGQDSVSLEDEQPKIDTDQDGLSDLEEMELGTNVSSVDSDNDGLFDMEEVKTYMTDPLNPDTDGDSYLDGQEVKSGYNPRGDGKL